MSDRDKYVATGEEILRLAFDIGGGSGVKDGVQAELMTLNGLLAIALMETFGGKPGKGDGVFYSPIGLANAIREQP